MKILDLQVNIVSVEIKLEKILDNFGLKGHIITVEIKLEEALNIFENYGVQEIL